jgi:uncharacterized DUF497 family protein
MTLRFRWNEAKAAANKRKHRISFETAARVFADPFALSDRIASRVANTAGRRSDQSKAA